MKQELIYDLLKEVREEVKVIRSTGEKNTIVLEEHQRRSLANESRLGILENQALIISYKKLGVFAGVLSSIGGLVYYVIKIFGPE